MNIGVKAMKGTATRHCRNVVELYAGKPAFTFHFSNSRCVVALCSPEI
uniref:Uncharacterized protein n=1 Tax=Anguilla anguilla TaxID=7936 RepID=A0A0E9W5Z9_ANGAN